MVASASNERATSIASASRVNSSVALHSFNDRASLVVSNLVIDVAHLIHRDRNESVSWHRRRYDTPAFTGVPSHS